MIVTEVHASITALNFSLKLLQTAALKQSPRIQSNVLCVVTASCSSGKNGQRRQQSLCDHVHTYRFLCLKSKSCNIRVMGSVYWN